MPDGRNHPDEYESVSKNDSGGEECEHWDTKSGLGWRGTSQSIRQADGFLRQPDRGCSHG